MGLRLGVEKARLVCQQWHGAVNGHTVRPRPVLLIVAQALGATAGAAEVCGLRMSDADP